MCLLRAGPQHTQSVQGNGLYSYAELAHRWLWMLRLVTKKLSSYTDCGHSHLPNRVQR